MHVLEVLSTFWKYFPGFLLRNWVLQRDHVHS